MFSRRKVKTLAIVSILYFTMSLSVIFTAEVQAAPSDAYFFKLRILYQSNSDSSNVANLLAQELRRIRIDSTLLSYPGGAYESAVLSKDFDVVFVEIEWPNSDVDPTYIFNTEGAANYWGITSTMNGSLENNAYLKAGQLEIDGNTRIDIYHDWQDNVMDKILPIIPLYNDLTSYSAWGTLDGWNHDKGIIASLPFMEWSSKHYGQDNTSVFVDYADEWNILNPLFIEDTMLASLVAEPLIRIDSVGAPQSVLAENWSFNPNKTILTITLRDNIYWQPDADLVYPSELFTTNDVAFSLQMYQNISTIGTYYRWVKDMVLESSSVIHLIIDGDKDTPGLQSYAPALNELDKLMLPEHYLNVSLDIHGLPDTTHDNWGDYSENGLGTGMYYLKHYSEGVEGVFRSNDDWWGTRADAFDDDLDITEYRVRFLPDLTTKMLEYESGALDIFKDYREY
ncbi:MAG: ABC transporter substrate-binding protein, partial [Candidatus Heimdallarchaeota archaeon]